MTGVFRTDRPGNGGWAEVGWPDPAPGDVYAIARLASACSAKAELAGQVRAGLSSVSSAGSSWEGEAATEFHNRLGDLTPHLDRVRNSFTMAASAVTGYANALPDLQARADRLLPRAVAADRARLAADAFSAQTFTVLPNPEAQAAIDELKQVRREYEEIVHDHKAAVGRCRDALSDASEAGMRNDAWSWMRRHLRDYAQTTSTWMDRINAAATVGAVGSLTVFPPAAPVLEIVAVGAGIVSLGADATVVGTDIAYGGPVKEDAVELAINAVFVGKTLSARDAMNAAEQKALRSSLQAAEADRQFDRALGTSRYDVANELAEKKARIDATTRAALDESRRIDARDKETDLAKIGADAGGTLGKKLTGRDEDDEKGSP